MDQRQFVLLEALKRGAVHTGEMRLFSRGKLPGLFAQRTRLHVEVADQAIREGLLEVKRREAVGTTTLEWVCVTQKGLDQLLQSESPVRALQELRLALDALSQRLTEEVRTLSQGLEQIAHRADEAIRRLEQERAPTPPSVPWAQQALAVLQQRRQVGLGNRCPLGELYAALKERQQELTIREFHQGLKRLQQGELVRLEGSSADGDTPGPEYALLDGAQVYYYVVQVGERGR
jgi:hypothetical protein